MSENIIQLSEKLLWAVKMNEPTQDLVTQLENLSWEDLKKGLSNDIDKKTFWINAYNAFFQILRKEKKIEKPKIYKEKLLTIAGQKMSLDDMEHGILRKQQNKYSLGFLPKVFNNKQLKDLEVETLDERIHFALNCGAKSCPPIAFYSADKLDQQLELATLSFLEGETDILTEEKEVHLSQLFKWYYDDFGGQEGIEQMIKEKLGVEVTGFKLVYKDYSWEEELDNFVVLDEG